MEQLRSGIPVGDRLIFALDVDDDREALPLVDKLGPSVNFYKLGLQLFTSRKYFDVLEHLTSAGKKVFADLKFFDVPETVSAAVRGIARTGAYFATVHGDQAIMHAAAVAKGDLKILAVTVLTSLDQNDMEQMGFAGTLQDLALSRARAAKKAGCDGIVCSGREAAAMRAALGDKFLIVTPGIRPGDSSIKDRSGIVDHQKRVVTPQEAIKAGADYIVVGRPIRDAADPKIAAEQIQISIAEVV